MPPTRVATRDQSHLRCSSERKTTNRATSVPVNRPGNAGLESSRSKKQELPFLDVEGTPLSSSPGRAMARGRKRDLSPPATSQASFMSNTSATVIEATADTIEPRPPKRPKRSLSTPPATRSSRLSTQLQSRRRSRSRAGSPTMDVKHVPPSRVSARLAHKLHPFIQHRSSDIYTHLADSAGTGNLLNEPSTGSIILSTSSGVVSAPATKLRGRRRKTVDLRDENVKKDLMEEWAQLRQSQGTLPLSGINGNTCLSQMLLRDTRKGDGPVSFVQLEAVTRRNSPDPDHAKSQVATIISNSQLDQTTFDVPINDSSVARLDLEGAVPADMDWDKSEHKVPEPPLDAGTEQPMIPCISIEVPSISISRPRVDEDILNDTPAVVPEATNHHDVRRYPGSSPARLTGSCSRESSVHIRHRSRVNDHADATSLDDPLGDIHNVTRFQTLSSGDFLDPCEEFYMLDVPDIFTLPWMPVEPKLYVPPGLGKLISGMKEQLMTAAQARRRAEELYQAELGRRISAEKIIEELRAELEVGQKDGDFSAGTAAEPQQDR